MKKKQFEYKLAMGQGADGKIYRKSFYSTKSKSDAKKKAMKWKEKAAVEQFLTESSPIRSARFTDWGKRCIETYKKGCVKGNTYTGTYYDPLVNHLIPHFGTKKLEDITQLQIQEYVTAACEKYEVATVKKDVVVLDLIFRMAVKNGLCKKNPVDEIKYPYKPSAHEKEAFTQEQYDKAYELAKNWPNGTAIMLMLATGVSRSELLGLRWEDLDNDNHYIHINQGLVTYRDLDLGCNVLSADGLKNKYRKRTIPIIDDDLWQRLYTLDRRVTVGKAEVETTFVFHNAKGKAWDPNTWASRVFRPFMQALCAANPGYPMLSPHELRHTRATLWVAQGMDTYMVARLLGHSDTKMLAKVYDHTRPETLKAALLKTNKDEVENDK